MSKPNSDSPQSKARMRAQHTLTEDGWAKNVALQIDALGRIASIQRDAAGRDAGVIAPSKWADLLALDAESITLTRL